MPARKKSKVKAKRTIRTMPVRRRPAAVPKPTAASPDAVITLADAERLSGVGKRTLLAEAAAGAIGARYVGGTTGWITTRDAVLAWAAGKPGPGKRMTIARNEVDDDKPESSAPMDGGDYGPGDFCEDEPPSVDGTEQAPAVDDSKTLGVEG